MYIYIAKARPDSPHYRVSERAKSISSHKGAEGNKLPPPSEYGSQRSAKYRRCCAMCRRCCAMCHCCCHWSFIILFGAKLNKLFHFSK